MTGQEEHDTATSARRDELLAVLRHVGPLRSETFTLPGTSDTLRISRPSDFDRLLDQAEGDPEQNLPYWAELWPSGIALATSILRRPETVAGRRVLEIGCGLGVTAIAALRAGADLLVTDYSVEALDLCALNTLVQAGQEPRRKQVNWRSPGALAGIAPFPVVLAADVLYEARDVEPLLAFVERVVTPGGVLWLAEPGRRPASAFLAAIRDRRWTGGSERYPGPWPDPDDNRKGVVVGVHKLVRP